MLILSAPARSIVNMSSTDLMPPPTVSGMKHWSAARSITSTIVAAAMRGGGDVEEHHFVRALLVVAEGEFHRVADVAQFARLGLAELDAARDLAVVNVETRNDSFGNHHHISTEGNEENKGRRCVWFLRSLRWLLLIFTGCWNC